MKNYLRFLSPVMLLLMAVMFGGGGKILAQTANLTFTAKCGGKGTDNQKGAWVISSDAKESNYIDGKGIHYGTKDVDVSYITATTKAYSTKKITKIIVNASAYETGSPKVSCTVGGVSFGTEQALTNTNTPYTFEGTATGDIVVKVSKTKCAKALYLKSIEVTYKEDDGKTPTTLSFANSETSFTYDLNSNDGTAVLVNPATLSPAVEGATISYAISESTFADGGIFVDNGTVIFSTDKEASATITASYAGNDTYEASTASYTIKVVDPNTLVFSDDYKSFDEISSEGYNTAATPRDYNLLANNKNNYTFNLKYSYRNQKGIQMKKSSAGVVISPKFGFSYGYTVTIEYTSGNGITLSAGDKTVTGTASSSISLTTTSDIPFTIKTGSEYAVVTTIQVVANTAPKTESLTTSAGGYATYSADYAVNYSELGLTAYTLTVDETNKTVTAKEFTGVVPAGGAVLVKGDASTAYTLTPATTEGDATFATALQTGATKADGTQYGFTTKSGTPAFAQVVSGQDIPAKKGYIVLKGASAAKYSICFNDEATGIHTIEAASAANGAMYNLAGQRVDKAYKGIVIVNGKKYLNK